MRSRSPRSQASASKHLWHLKRWLRSHWPYSVQWEQQGYRSRVAMGTALAALGSWEPGCQRRGRELPALMAAVTVIVRPS